MQKCFAETVPTGIKHLTDIGKLREKLFEEIIFFVKILKKCETVSGALERLVTDTRTGIGRPISLEKWYQKLMTMCMEAGCTVVNKVEKYFWIRISIFRDMTLAKSQMLLLALLAYCMILSSFFHKGLVG